MLRVARLHHARRVRVARNAAVPRILHDVPETRALASPAGFPAAAPFPPESPRAVLGRLAAVFVAARHLLQRALARLSPPFRQLHDGARAALAAALAVGGAGVPIAPLRQHAVRGLQRLALPRVAGTDLLGGSRALDPALFGVRRDQPLTRVHAVAVRRTRLPARPFRECAVLDASIAGAEVALLELVVLTLGGLPAVIRLDADLPVSRPKPLVARRGAQGPFAPGPPFSVSAGYLHVAALRVAARHFLGGQRVAEFSSVSRRGLHVARPRLLTPAARLGTLVEVTPLAPAAVQRLLARLHAAAPHLARLLLARLATVPRRLLDLPRPVLLAAPARGAALAPGRPVARLAVAWRLARLHVAGRHLVQPRGAVLALVLRVLQDFPRTHFLPAAARVRARRPLLPLAELAVDRVRVAVRLALFCLHLCAGARKPIAREVLRDFAVPLPQPRACAVAPRRPVAPLTVDGQAASEVAFGDLHGCERGARLAQRIGHLFYASLAELLTDATARTALPPASPLVPNAVLRLYFWDDVFWTDFHVAGFHFR
mmetsp:Transcript_3655/g.8741  ORF Transcript_3655/g.8741 Transcript_3655/m.8741 type:complete len:544 (-) Transcript_3655:1353-2984(-)